MTDSLSWRRGATIPIRTVDQSELDRVRQVNLDYAAKLPDLWPTKSYGAIAATRKGSRGGWRGPSRMRLRSRTIG
jgi:hypothetical protein